MTQLDVIANMYKKHMEDPYQIEKYLISLWMTFSDKVNPEDLFSFNQDHFDGIEATKICKEYLQPNESDKILEIWSGYGWVLSYLNMESHAKCIGVEIQSDRCETARKLVKMTNQDNDISFINGDFNEIEFDQNFDMIVSMWAILHIIDKKKTLNKIWDLLKVWGRLYIEDFVLWKEPTDEEKKILLENNSVPNLLTKADYFSILTSKGLKIIKDDDMTQHWTEYANNRVDNEKKCYEENIRKIWKEKTDAWLSFAQWVADMFNKWVLNWVRFLAVKS